jgi:AcrR family transcriptional regulator
MGRRSNAKRVLLETAAELFWRNGFGATSISDILEASGLGSGSLYWFYRSKEELLVAVLENYRRRLTPVIERPALEASDDPIGRVFAILDVYRRFLIDTRFELGCPIGSVVLELGGRSPAVRRKTAEIFEAWRAMIVRCLEPAAERFPEGFDIDGLAAFVLTTMEGGIMQARAEREIGPFDASVAHLRAYFDTILALPPA